MAERRVWLAAALALLCAAAFLGLNLRGNIAFVLELRALKLLALVQVAVAVAVATVLLQTITGNRILTPSIMGLDALYLLGQTALVFLLGGIGFAAVDPRLKFVIALAAMVGLAAAVFLPLVRARHSLTVLLLTGALLGILFRSLSSLLARLIDPNDFAVLQGVSYANFNAPQGELLAIGAVLTAVAAAVAWRQRHVLDVMALGPAGAISLGVDWRWSVAGVLLLVVLLVAVSTALVGPVAFLGLLVVALAERLTGTRRHAVLLPAAACIAVTVLAGGQAVLQHGLGGASTLGVVVEFLGGLVFLLLLATGNRR
ncbi:iron chelate uptake ABC transporter family permease subunit [Azospirillum halopraeferens]|uniref:iron chelate uptake ABC transporter family permease subunit n=1 Tax=Azospirillum halopraeferens TaxID=34010 RepID=UPI000417AEC6|nr:iron chelate uptake ABC transporter family permease subunit [Azospirillum halopraeferens]